MSQRNSKLRRIFAHVVAGKKSGRHWHLQSGRLRKLIKCQRSTLLWVIGNKLANRTTGYIEVKSDGTISGHLNKSHQAAMMRKNVDAITTLPLIINTGGQHAGSGIGSRDFCMNKCRLIAITVRHFSNVSRWFSGKAFRLFSPLPWRHYC